MAAFVFLPGGLHVSALCPVGLSQLEPRSFAQAGVAWVGDVISQAWAPTLCIFIVCAALAQTWAHVLFCTCANAIVIPDASLRSSLMLPALKCDAC